MAGDGITNAPRLRKRVEAESSSSSSSSALKRAKDGSAFARCEECNKDVAVALIGFHDCSLEARIKMKLESQVVDIPNEVDAKKKPAAEKRNAKSTEPKQSRKKKPKDPNAVKRPQTAFFLFMDDFRKSFKETNPDTKGAAKVSTEGGVKWRTMTDEEKKPYTDRAAVLKAEYAKTNDAENERNDAEEEKVVEEEELAVEEKVVEEE